MRCPNCKAEKTKVTDSRASKYAHKILGVGKTDPYTVVRRRKCLKCNHTFYTSEQIIRK